MLFYPDDKQTDKNSDATNYIDMSGCFYLLFRAMAPVCTDATVVSLGAGCRFCGIRKRVF